MTRRSDFTEKLLGDLRRRKECMTTYQESKGSNQISADKYRSFKQPSQGSRQINFHENSGSNTRYMNKWSGKGHNRSFSIDESSKEMVLAGRSHTSESIADLSMAVAFALKNNGTHRKMGSSVTTMSSFLQQVGRSVDLAEMDRNRSILPSNSQFPTLSNLHIKEISNGAQKLNQILSACYNGLNFDKQTGQELLKGAMDLEESLRMLLNLQEASEYMVGHHRKQRAKLIEVEDDNSEAIEEVDKQKKFDPPVFSFDRPSRISLKDVGNVRKTTLLEQRELASSPSDGPKIASGKLAPSPSNVGSHRRSVSCSSVSSPATISKKNLGSDCRQEKKRIPSVIAKLMGLEELPALKETQIDSLNEVKKETTAGKESKKISHENRNQAESVLMSSETKSGRQKVVGTNNFVTMDTTYTDHADTISMTQISVLKEAAQEEKQHLNEKICKQGKKIAQDRSNLKIHKGVGTNGTKRKQETRMILEMPLPHTKQGKTLIKETMHQKEKKTANDNRLLTVSKEQKLPNDKLYPHDSLRKSEKRDIKLQTTKKERQTVRNKFHIIKPKGMDKVILNINSTKSTHDVMNLQMKTPNMNPTTTSKNPKQADDALPEVLNSSHHENQISPGNSNNLNLNKKKSAKENIEKQRPTPENAGTDFEKVAGPVTKVEITKPIHNQCFSSKVDNTETPKNVIPREIEDEGKPESYSSVLQEINRTRHERNGKKVSTTVPKEEASMQLDLTHDMQKNVEPTKILGNYIPEEREKLREPEIVNLNSKIQQLTEEVSDTPNTSMKSHCNDKEFKNSDILIPIKGLNENSKIGVFESSGKEQQKSPESVTPRSLTENEIHLMQILVKSQLFLNAAEALFKLQIPVSILHASAQICQDEDTKLLLDCGFEVMKRKGRRKELTLYPSSSISISSKKVECLNDLVMELYEDLETFKFFEANENFEYDVADCIYKMLQKDIYNNTPDVNSMWDLGWNDTMFACIEKEEVIRDVEKYVLNGLLNEVTKDFLHICVVI